MDLVSIIIPVYNVEKYLRKCLDSVFAQSYSNLEVIIINDGATDGTGVICEEYAKKHQNMIYIEQKNAGQSSARNKGLEIAKGDFICFLDSDDYISEHFVEILHKRITSESVDIVQCGVVEIDYSKTFSTNVSKDLLLTSSEAIRSFLQYDWEDKIIRPAVWNKFFRAKLIKDIRFWEGRISEDFYYTFEAFLRAKKILCIADNLYYHIYTNDQSTTRKRFEKKHLDLLYALEYLINRTKEMDNQEIKRASNILYLSNANRFFYFTHKYLADKEEMKHIKSTIKECLDRLSGENIPLKIGIRSRLLVTFPALYIAIMEIINWLRQHRRRK